MPRPSVSSVGSGLILLLIVGAWLAVLVPMALRSPDLLASRSAERLGDAVRVLSRRRRRTGHRPATARVEEGVGKLAPAPRLGRVEPMLTALRRPRAARPRTAAQRRRVVLLSLLAATAAALLGGLLTVWLLGLGVVLLAATAGYVVHLRRLVARRHAALREQEQERRRDELWEQALEEQERALAAQYAGQHVTSLDPNGGDPYPELWPDDGDTEEAPSYLPQVVAATYPDLRVVPDPVPARRRVPAAAGETWTPVPVPPPLYLSAPAPRVRGVGSSAAGRAAAPWSGDADLERDARRAVGGW